MCGICGQVNINSARPVDRTVLERMNTVIRHRGPDSDGFYIHGGVGLAARRLAIIDLITGDQPLSNENGTIWIVFNGEIYNFPELRSKLEAKGHIFRSNSDTETIVHLYEEHGSACVEQLRGMFAFAIWDENQRQLLLARDRLGVKPLYYTEYDGALLFGSELKCILEYPNLSREIDLEAIHHYLTLQYVPDPWTAFKGIQKLAPAHRLIWREGEILIDRYWDLAFEPKLELSEDDIEQSLRELVTEAVRIRLVSDVPLGAHLSGGIDSSIVVGLMAGMVNQPVKTFSIGFKEGGFNELPYARQVAQEFSTDHHEFILEPNAVEVLPKLVQHFDEPFADPAAIPTWYLAQMTHRHVTVALNGDGGDEAFAGYQRYYGDLIADLYRLVPGYLRHTVINRVLQVLPVQNDRPPERSKIMALRQLASAAELSNAASVVRWERFFSEVEKFTLYNDNMRTAINNSPSTQLLEETYRQAKANNRLDRTLYTDIHNYLPGALLPKVDRTTMASSLEARSPFLDHHVMEFAARLPTSYKIRGQQTKWILRKVFADLLPTEIAKRGKVGFSIPLGMWFRDSLYPAARDLLLAPDTRLHDYFNPVVVSELLEQNKRGQMDHGKRIWSLLNLEVWLRKI
jgi:asparagine synthase (glutamine-hydrolysing)